MGSMCPPLRSQCKRCSCPCLQKLRSLAQAPHLPPRVAAVAGAQEARSPLAPRPLSVLVVRRWVVPSLATILQNTASMRQLMQLVMGLLMLQRQPQTLQWMPESLLWMPEKTLASLSWTSFDRLGCAGGYLFWLLRVQIHAKYVHAYDMP